MSTNADFKTTDNPSEQGFPEFEMSRNMLTWMRNEHLSVFVTSYKSNRVYSFGTVIHPKHGLMVAVYQQALIQPMGIKTFEVRAENSADNNAYKGMYITTRGQLVFFSNEGVSDDREYTDLKLKYDGTYVWRIVHSNGDIDQHDIDVDSKGQVYFCSAKFNCIAKPSSSGKSFAVHYMPEWIDKLSQEDRCHLNGFAMRDDRPRYITCAAKTNSYGAWHEGKRRIGAGVVHDIKYGVTVCAEGLTMPHSPRWHDGKLWVLNAGEGSFGYIDGLPTDEELDAWLAAKSSTNAVLAAKHAVDGPSLIVEHSSTDAKLPTTNTKIPNIVSGVLVGAKYVPVKFLSGFLRGLRFTHGMAVIGSSSDRHEKHFQDLPLGQRMEKEGLTAKCGVFVVEMKNFDIVNSITFSSLKEIYDVEVCDSTRPCILTGDEYMSKFNLPGF